MRPRLRHRARWLWEHPGLYLTLGTHELCLVPYPKGRAHKGRTR